MKSDIYFYVFAVCAFFTRRFARRDIISKEFSVVPLWLSSLLGGYAGLMLFCGKSIGFWISPNEFGEFLGRFLLFPSGYIALVIIAGNQSFATIYKMCYKVLLLLLQIGFSLTEVYSGQNDAIALDALGISVTLAMFDIADEMKDDIPKVIEQIKAETKIRNNRTLHSPH